MKKDKDIGVELSSHTNSKKSKKYNQQLSQKRANKTVEYVMSKGINKNRIITKGYGEIKPLTKNKLSNGKDNPKEKAKNKHPEFKIIKIK